MMIRRDGQSAAFAFDPSIIDHAKGSSRVQLLANLVQRLNDFIDLCFDKLVSLCISK